MVMNDDELLMNDGDDELLYDFRDQFIGSEATAGKYLKSSFEHVFAAFATFITMRGRPAAIRVLLLVLETYSQTGCKDIKVKIEEADA
ncbi:hypothetical protein CEXT_130041 [Caerostris extrusa]|uniref:Uncharacterized protein n=1 Tax=Caerostris extrusa TaxID=172846 RepID=A0AAV4TAU8_CAEEX|nr:hypothetical protein CEXT_130041 [Caerostris extrusa]